MLANLSSRLLMHELKRGELTIMLLAVILAVSSVFSLTSFSENLQEVVNEKSKSFLAADRVVGSSKPIDNDWLDKATLLDLQQAHQIRFSSMLYFDDELKLASVKAVDSNYPLKGEITTRQEVWGVDSPTQASIQPGEVWITNDFFQVLNVQLGDTVEIGDAELVVAKILATTPDQDFNPIGANDVVLMHIDDVVKTDVIQPGSRVGYRVGLSGEDDQLTEFEEWLRPQLNRDLHYWISTQDSDSPVGNAVKRAENYFLLASLLSILLAATAIGIAAKRYAERHYDVVAILKTLGASQKQIVFIFIWHLSCLLLLGMAIGIGLGALGQYFAFVTLAEYLPDEFTNLAFSYRSLWLAILTGVICGGLFSLVPLINLFKIPPLRVFQRQMGTSSALSVVGYITTGIAIFLLMWLYSQNLKLTALLFLSSCVAIALLLAISKLSFWTTRKAGGNAGSAWKLAVARVYRRGQENSIQLISFTLAIKLFLIILVLKGDLIGQWQDSVKPGTPNHFVVNVAANQPEQFKQTFAAQDIAIDNMFPIIRGRLTAINGELLNTEVTKEEREKGEESERVSIGRELSLTTTDQLPVENQIVQGGWWTESPEQQQVSVEEKLAERLNITLGDTLTFTIAGSEVEVPVTSIRSVKWETMSPNFFMIFSDVVLEEFAATYIASFYLPEDKKPLLNQLMAPFPSSSLIDIDAIMDQIREISNQASMAIEFIFLLVFIAGVLVLTAQTQASMGERRQELMVLRMLGSRGKVIRMSIVYEFIFLGALAGLFAALATEIALWGVKTHIFRMEWSIEWSFWLLAPVGGAIVLAVLGGLSCAGLLKQTIQQQKLQLE